MTAFIKQASAINKMDDIVSNYTKSDETMPYAPYRVECLLAYAVSKRYSGKEGAGEMFELLIGAAVLALTITYWDKIKRWLDTIVADKIEKVFGYGARKRVHHAVTIVDRVASGIREEYSFMLVRSPAKAMTNMRKSRCGFFQM